MIIKDIAINSNRNFFFRLLFALPCSQKWSIFVCYPPLFKIVSNPIAFNDPTQTFDYHRVRDMSYISFPITRGRKQLIVSHRTCTSSQMQLAQRRALRDVNQLRSGEDDRLICFFVGAARCSSRRRTHLQCSI